MSANKILDHWLIIGNPTAAKGKVSLLLPTIKILLKKNQINYELQLSTRKRQATDLVIAGIKKGFRKIIGIGGDGTNNEIINGIVLQKNIPSNEIIYTLLSVGTGNDWVKTHGIPTKPDLFFQQLKTGEICYQDIGQADFYKNGIPQKRYFANIAGMAYDAFVVKLISEQSSSFSNKMIYTIYLLKCLYKYSLQKAQVIYNHKIVEDYFYSINIAIGRYAGGGLLISPHAIPDDGKLAISLFRNISKINVLLNYYRFFNGTIGKHPKIDLCKTNVVKVVSKDKQPVLLELDGELVGETPVEFKLIKNALKVWIPKARF
ncbi:MAG TPA: diacylglycerol kinase family lipid kinase [Saprospiraceae bacterium]|nr:diacylglycerol kinase family lipid kinase [Saprospiraceae bacterium]